MLIEMERGDLESLLKGTCPYYSAIDHPLIKRAGKMSGKFGPDWSWYLDLSEFTDSELYQMYNICKQSWEQANSDIPSTSCKSDSIQSLNRSRPDLLDERHALMVNTLIPIAIDISMFGDQSDV